MEQNTQVQPQGKGLGVAGFVISLIALVLWFIISGIALIAAVLGGGMGLAIGWLVFSLLGMLLSVMGFMKLSKTGGKKGLAITGGILGIVAVIMSVTTVLGVNRVHTSGVGGELQKAVHDMTDSLKKAQQQ